MEHYEIYQTLLGRFGADVICEHVVTGTDEKGRKDPYIRVKTESLEEVCRYLHEESLLGFDMLHCISGVDYPDRLESVYHIWSMSHKHWVILKAYTDKDAPVVPSVAHIWPAANWLERETYDLVGIRYEGHPDMKRILLDVNWEGHPLRKDYVFPEHDDLRSKGY